MTLIAISKDPEHLVQVRAGCTYQTRRQSRVIMIQIVKSKDAALPTLPGSAGERMRHVIRYAILLRAIP
jgi:hypothetical protein